MPGYGNSNGRADNFKQANIEWIIQCLDKLELNKNIVLIMPSMSGIYGLKWMFDTEYNKYLHGVISIAPAFCDEFDKQKYQQLSIPTCIIYGQRDETGLHNISNAYLSEIPNSEQFMIEDGAHACYLKSNAKQFHQIMIDFLDRIENMIPLS